MEQFFFSIVAVMKADHFQVIILAVVAVILLAIGIVVGFQLRRKYYSSEPTDRDAWSGLTGSAAIVAMLQSLQQLLRRPPSTQSLHAYWDRLEMPLVQAIPDCPPALKAALREALEGLHGLLRHRQYMQRVMTVRNSLVEQ